MAATLPALQFNGILLDGESISSVLTLPALQISSSLDTGTIISGTLLLPSLVINAESTSGGEEAGVLLPSLVISGTIAVGKVITGTLTLPALGLSGYLQNPALTYMTGVLPALEGKLYGGGYGLFTLDKITFTATGSVGISGVMSNDISLSFTATGYGDSRGVLENDIKIAFTASGHIGTSTFKALVINLKNSALTKYLNYNFNSFCFLNGKYIAASDDGIFELTGDTDNYSPISWKFRTGFIDLEGKDYRKTLRHIWLGYSSTGDLTLSIITQEGEQYDYAVNSIFQDTDGTARIKIGKGIRSRYIKIEIANKEYETIMLDKMRIFVESSKTKKR